MLADRAGTSASLASSHLGRLLDGGLVEAERRGRRRYYRLAGPEVADAIEGLLAIAPSRAAGNLREARTGEAIRRPHLAGALGASIAQRILELGWVERLPRTRALLVTTDGARHLRREFGLELPS